MKIMSTSSTKKQRAVQPSTQLAGKRPKAESRADLVEGKIHEDLASKSEDMGKRMKKDILSKKLTSSSLKIPEVNLPDPHNPRVEPGQVGPLNAGVGKAPTPVL
ncbi:hypothetical protein R1flu_024722 [Riccia fluitans]|uniref:Uncharacterized protein n=1 Tax=Riccia fluitans TaxID=41844 RepID=A0ABD1XW53_9MARC